MNAFGVIVGAILGIGAASLLALGMVVQRYALLHDADTPIKCLCTNKCTRNWAWIGGLALYGLANGLYSPGLLLAPLSLMGSIFTLLLVFNLLFARIILKEVLTPPKVAGAIIILVGVSLVACGTPPDAKNDFTTSDIVDLFHRPAGVFWCLLLLSAVVTSALAIVWYEHRYPMDLAKVQPTDQDIEANPGEVDRAAANGAAEKGAAA